MKNETAYFSSFDRDDKTNVVLENAGDDTSRSRGYDTRPFRTIALLTF